MIVSTDFAILLCLAEVLLVYYAATYCVSFLLTFRRIPHRKKTLVPITIFCEKNQKLASLPSPLTLCLFPGTTGPLPGTFLSPNWVSMTPIPALLPLLYPPSFSSADVCISLIEDTYFLLQAKPFA